jgi:glycosyltransferase involved in cell wall biosynthesis
MNRIAHITFSLEVGGAENLLVDIANDQIKHSSVSIVIVNNKYHKDVADRISKDVKVLLIGRKEGGWGLGGPFRIWKWLWNYKPDVIHCHHHKLINLLSFWRNKCVLTAHDVGLPTCNLKKYKKVFSISAAVQQDLFNRAKVFSTVIYNGIAIDQISRKSACFYNPSTIYKIVQVSRLYHEKKGQHIAIKALRKLHDDGYANIRLYFIGEGPSRSFLQKLTKELNLEDSIHFLGSKERTWIYKNLVNFDLLVQPSLYEGFGLTVIEGIAAGLPVIASNVDGPAEILNGIPGAFLFNTGKEGELVMAIKKVIDLSENQKIKELCTASIDIVSQKYSICQTANHYLNSYDAPYKNLSTGLLLTE